MLKAYYLNFFEKHDIKVYITALTQYEEVSLFSKRPKFVHDILRNMLTLLAISCIISVCLFT